MKNTLPKTELDAKIDQYWNMRGSIKHYNYSFTETLPDRLVDEYYIDPELDFEYGVPRYESGGRYGLPIEYNYKNIDADRKSGVYSIRF